MWRLRISRPPLSSDIIIFTDRPELKAKGERIIFEDREVKKRKFSLRETALFNPDPILAKISRILTENWIIPVNWPFFHSFCAPMAYFRWILDDIDVSYPFATFYIQKNWFLGPKGQNLEIFKIFNQAHVWGSSALNMLPQVLDDVCEQRGDPDDDFEYWMASVPCRGAEIWASKVFWVISWTTESISTMVNYTLWVCCNQPRATFNHRVKHQTFQTKFLCKTINTARFLKLSAFFRAIICPFWFKTSKVMTLLTFCIDNYRPICVKALF